MVERMDIAMSVQVILVAYVLSQFIGDLIFLSISVRYSHKFPLVFFGSITTWCNVVLIYIIQILLLLVQHPQTLHVLFILQVVAQFALFLHMLSSVNVKKLTVRSAEECVV